METSIFKIIIDLIMKKYFVMFEFLFLHQMLHDVKKKELTAVKETSHFKIKSSRIRSSISIFQHHQHLILYTYISAQSLTYRNSDESYIFSTDSVINKQKSKKEKKKRWM